MKPIHHEKKEVETLGKPLSPPAIEIYNRLYVRQRVFLMPQPTTSVNNWVYGTWSDNDSTG